MHIITSLATGGAEMTLLRLLSEMDRTRFRSEVVCLRGQGVLGERLTAIGIRVYLLNMGKWPESLFAPFLLVVRLMKFRPDLIQGWMFHGNLAASVCGLISRRSRVLWNVRHSFSSYADEKRMTGWIMRLCILLSSSVNKVIYNSAASRGQYENLGSCSENGMVIPNGVDTSLYRPDKEARLRLLEAMGLPEFQGKIIGSAGRFHPMKDQATFIRAAGLLVKKKPEFLFVMIGRDVHRGNTALKGAIESSGLGNRLLFLGERLDLNRILGGMDIFTLTSAWGEAFPNVVVEAMSCGVPCVVTDIGESSEIVGDTGIIVPPRNPNAVASAWERILQLEEADLEKLGLRARERVLERYALEGVVAQYESLYSGVAELLSSG